MPCLDLVKTIEQGRLASLFYFLERGRRLEDRRKYVLQYPEWLLRFNPVCSSASRVFVDSVYNGILLQIKVKAKDFHSETGIIIRELVSYLQVLPVDRALLFFPKYMAYMRGEKLFFPFNQGYKDRYRILKQVSQSSYAKRLITEFREHGIKSTNWTQDYSVLYRVDSQSFLELILCAISYVEIVEEIEKFRKYRTP